MSAAATAPLTAAGIAMIALALRDIFDSLFPHGGKAVMSRWLMRATWRVLRWLPTGSGIPALAGAVTIVVVIASWALLLVLGWTLIFWPQMADGFHIASVSRGDFLDALYLSLVTLATLGYGDITPVESWLRVAAPLEALIGFGLLTASIAWLLSIYPALARRRSLAYELSLLRRAEHDTGIALLKLESEAAEETYAELTARLVAVERDLVTFPATYYFTERDDRFSLAAAMPYLLELAERGAGEGIPERTRLRAVMLRDAIDDFASTTSERFHGARSESTADLLRAYARDHS